MDIVFGSHPFEPRQPDPAYRDECDAARNAGHTVHIVSMESLFEEDNPERAVRWIPHQQVDQRAVFRGFMLTAENYSTLRAALAEKQLLLINNVQEYSFCHYLPENYPIIRHCTPKTAWFEVQGGLDESALRATLAPFGKSAVVVKDYVKSEKHYWDEACFIPSAADFTLAMKIVRRLIELRGPTLNRGIVVREFVPLASAGPSRQHDMPISVEGRLFFWRNERVLTVPYWDPQGELPRDATIAQLLACAKSIRSNFFTMDIARKLDGEWIIMELGDGQVAGLPEGLSPAHYYEVLSRLPN